MKNGTDSLRQNLLDAKCPLFLTEECMELAQEGKSGQMLRNLKEHRKNLLALIHENQKALDCLDYLVFQIEKERV